MNKKYIILLFLAFASLGLMAQTPLKFSGNRAQVSASGIYMIPQSTFFNYSGQTIYIDIVKSQMGASPKIGFENQTIGNRWGAQSGCWWAGNDAEMQKQYVDIDVAGTYSHSYGGKNIRIEVQYINAAQSNSPAISESKTMSLSAFDGGLTIKSEDIISNIEVYSSIGGLLYRSAVNATEVNITNLPKTILVVRATVGGAQLVQKFKMQ